MPASNQAVRQQHRPKQGSRQTKRAFHTGSKAWRLLRERVLVRDGWQCKCCGRMAEHVDHIDNNSHNNALSNLQSLCASCHSEKTATEQAGETWRPKGCDINGTPRYPGSHWR